MERLASFSRLVLFDRRGAGMSDPLRDASTADWEGWTKDLRAVLDSVGCERAAILAGRDAGPTAMLFAATYPERTSALILVNTAGRSSSQLGSHRRSAGSHGRRPATRSPRPPPRAQMASLARKAQTLSARHEFVQPSLGFPGLRTVHGLS